MTSRPRARRRPRTDPRTGRPGRASRRSCPGCAPPVGDHPLGIADIGNSRPAAVDSSSSRCRVIAPIRSPSPSSGCRPDREVVDVDQHSGRASRSFIIGSRLCRRRRPGPRARAAPAARARPPTLVGAGVLERRRHLHGDTPDRTGPGLEPWCGRGLSPCSGRVNIGDNRPVMRGRPDVHPAGGRSRSSPSSARCRAAAAALGVSEPAVSAAVTALRAGPRRPAVPRVSGSGIVLTPGGRASAVPPRAREARPAGRPHPARGGAGDLDRPAAGARHGGLRGARGRRAGVGLHPGAYPRANVDLTVGATEEARGRPGRRRRRHRPGRPAGSVTGPVPSTRCPSCATSGWSSPHRAIRWPGAPGSGCPEADRPRGGWPGPRGSNQAARSRARPSAPDAPRTSTAGTARAPPSPPPGPATASCWPWPMPSGTTSAGARWCACRWRARRSPACGGPACRVGPGRPALPGPCNSSSPLPMRPPRCWPGPPRTDRTRPTVRVELWS